MVVEVFGIIIVWEKEVESGEKVVVEVEVVGSIVLVISSDELLQLIKSNKKIINLCINFILNNTYFLVIFINMISAKHLLAVQDLKLWLLTWEGRW